MHRKMRCSCFNPRKRARLDLLDAIPGGVDVQKITNTVPKQPFRLLDLPVELRLEIYDLHFATVEDLSEAKKASKLLFTCHQVLDEAFPQLEAIVLPRLKAYEDLRAGIFQTAKQMQESGDARGAYTYRKRGFQLLRRRDPEGHSLECMAAWVKKVKERMEEMRKGLEDGE